VIKYPSQTEEVPTPCGKVYVHFLHQEGELCMIKARLGKNGGCPGAMAEGVCNVLTTAIQAGADLEKLIGDLQGISCRRPVVDDAGKRVLSCVDGLARALRVYLESR